MIKLYLTILLTFIFTYTYSANLLVVTLIIDIITNEASIAG